MTTFTWNGGNGTWQSPQSWTPPGPPTGYTGFGAYRSSDAAVFATGARTPYTVDFGGSQVLYYGFPPDPVTPFTSSNEAIVGGVTVTHDRVTFRNLALGSLGTVTIQGGGTLTLQATPAVPAFQTVQHEGVAGTIFTVADGRLNLDESMLWVSIRVSPHGSLGVSGSGVSVQVSPYSSLDIAAGGHATVSGGATLTSPYTMLAGALRIEGAGSEADLYNIFSPSGGALTGSISVGSGARFLGVPLLQGTVSLDGGTAGLTGIASGGKVTGHGTLESQSRLQNGSSGTVANDGSIIAQGGTLALPDPVTGSGDLAIIGPATLELGASTSEAIRFLGVAGKLLLDNGAQATGRISGFGLGDTIDLAGVTGVHKSVSYSGGDTMLSITGTSAGGAVSGSFHLAGHYRPGEFVTHADGHGGTAITDLVPGYASLSQALSATGTTLPDLPISAGSLDTAPVSDTVEGLLPHPG